MSGEDLDDKKRDLRDQLLEPLVEHIHDVNAFVRSKALQLWQKLAAKQVIPLNQQRKVLGLTTGRLHDKSSNVRKNAMQLLILLIQGNPFAARLPLEELEAKLKVEQDKLNQMAGDKGSRVDPSKCGPTREQLWKAMEPEIAAAVEQELHDQSSVAEDSDDEDGDEEMDDNDSQDEEREFFVETINKGDYRQAVRHLFDRGDQPRCRILGYLKKVFIGDGSDAAEQREMERIIQEEAVQEQQAPVEGAEQSREVGQQKMLVLYLSDSVAFARCVHQTIPVVCQLLFSKQTSDVLEAIDFFVTACEFDVLDSMVGVRRMLSLVWSSENDIKQAVVSAYKKLYMNVEVTNKKRAVQVVSNLAALVSGSTQGELASLEELVSMCVKTGDIHKLCIQVSFSRSRPISLFREIEKVALLCDGEI